MDNKILNTGTLAEYVSIISDVSKKSRNTLIHTDNLFFRGLGNSSYNLTPTLGREPVPSLHNSLISLEKEMVQEAIRKRPDIFTEGKYPIDLLTKLQHWGIPTRLLDVTTNALVALYFACLENETMGEIIVFFG